MSDLDIAKLYLRECEREVIYRRACVELAKALASAGGWGATQTAKAATDLRDALDELEKAEREHEAMAERMCP